MSEPISRKRARGDPLSVLELDAWRGMLRVHSKLIRELDNELAAEHGVSLSSYEVLLVLDEAPGGRLRMGELADSVLITRSGVTRLVDHLELAGLVKREDCPSDRRGLNAVITEAGRAALEKARPTYVSGVRKRFSDRFSGEELRTLGCHLDRVLHGRTTTRASPPAHGTRTSVKRVET